MSNDPASKPPSQHPSEMEHLRNTNQELAYQCRQKEQLYAELLAANEKLRLQQEDMDARAAELVIANSELKFQNEEKNKRARELHELIFHDILTGLPNRQSMI
ncbi:MAG: GGDEF-domain containing protein, partial [Pseudomonadota bacterium]